MYNQLHLKPPSLPLSLFLYNPNLSPDEPPDISVMTRAWYGVSSTGNQAGWAIEELARMNSDSLPAALSLLTEGRYVDDILGGAKTTTDRDNQIEQSIECLAKGGFGLKYVAKSEESPPEKATADGTSITCLGLSWDTGEDTLALDVNQMTVRKKVKGMKGIPSLSVESPEELKAAIQNNFVSKAAILGRIAEMFDPMDYGSQSRSSANSPSNGSML
jgi:hypothetical protein